MQEVAGTVWEGDAFLWPAAAWCAAKRPAQEHIHAYTFFIKDQTTLSLMSAP
jgi:hypothetical protein